MYPALNHAIYHWHRDIQVRVFVKYCMSQTQHHTGSVPLSPPPLNSLQIEFPSFPSFLNLYLDRNFPQQLILLSICSILLDRSIFGIFNLRGGREIVAYPYFLDSRWDPSQGPSDPKFNGYQIGAFPEIRLTAPSPAPTSDQVDPLRTSDSPAERSACQCTSPPALSH
ncbi:hypothetical protein N7449_000265 [Penicillium cf. viridicatum]|uniref:Uncharacterized protein n=1 Tax=Penicillium cf. viridicatum TaxID=2972119 RepID=A0A9W9T8C8_9EURO|nr:hypothetical protein N7449_000265 [Penicillium cf. viridicatum]